MGDWWRLVVIGTISVSRDHCFPMGISIFGYISKPEKVGEHVKSMSKAQGKAKAKAWSSTTGRKVRAAARARKENFLQKQKTTMNDL